MCCSTRRMCRALTYLWTSTLTGKWCARDQAQESAMKSASHASSASVQVSKRGAVVCRPHRRGFTLPTGKAIPFTMVGCRLDVLLH